MKNKNILINFINDLEFKNNFLEHQIDVEFLKLIQNYVNNINTRFGSI